MVEGGTLTQPNNIPSIFVQCGQRISPKLIKDIKIWRTGRLFVRNSTQTIFRDVGLQGATFGKVSLKCDQNRSIQKRIPDPKKLYYESLPRSNMYRQSFYIPQMEFKKPCPPFCMLVAMPIPKKYNISKQHAKNFRRKRLCVHDYRKKNPPRPAAFFPPPPPKKKRKKGEVEGETFRSGIKRMVSHWYSEATIPARVK